MSEALTKYLKDFSQYAPVEDTMSLDLDMPAASFDSDWASDPEPVVDLDEERRKAFAEGEAAARPALVEAHEAELDALRARHRDEMEAQRLRYEDEIAGHLAMSVISMKQTIAQHVEEVCLKLFSELMEREVAERATLDLSAHILREIDGGFAGTVRISGPDRLLTKLREALGDVDNHVEYHASDDIDIQVHMDNSVLMTRLAEFFQTVRGLSDE